jgi:Rrf2 family protein
MKRLMVFILHRVVGDLALVVMSDRSNGRCGEDGRDNASRVQSQAHDMKLSKRGEYALRALIDLGIASELGWPMLQISELATKEKLPIKFLEQIFMQLKAAGYVKSRRGKFGGYSLARPMSQIKFGAVIRLIGGPLAPIRCVSATSYARCSCPDEIHCGLRMLMFDVRNAISAVLDRFTLADIVEITLRKYRRDKVSPPFLHRSIPLASVLSTEDEPPIRGRSRMEARKQFSGSRGNQSENGRTKAAAK